MGASPGRVQDRRPDQPALTSPPARPASLITAAVAAAVIATDQLTKWWALERLPRGSIHVVWTLRLALARNTGAAFSILSGKGVGPAIALAAVAVIAALALGIRNLRTPAGRVAAGLVIGGALGNLADRAFRSDHGFMQGAVVDFIDLQWWPVFNVADACVVVGALLIAAVATFHKPAP